MSNRPSTAVLSARERRAFVLKKLHSLSGVAPVGLYLVFHLWTNARALQGQVVYDQAVTEIAHLPYLLALEIVGIYIPLLFHALYGIVLAFESRPNVRRYAYSRNWMYTLQRATGLVAFAFIAWHVWQFRIQVALGHMAKADFFPTLCSSLSSTQAGIPVVALVYLIGIAATVFHFTNGLYGFCFSWGITVSRRATRITSALFGIAGIVLFVISANTVIYFATGSRLVLSTESAAEPPAVSCRDVGGKTAAAHDNSSPLASLPHREAHGDN